MYICYNLMEILLLFYEKIDLKPQAITYRLISINLSKFFTAQLNFRLNFITGQENQ